MKHNIEYFKSAISNKTNWIRAIQFVIWEYENNCHKRETKACAFCRLVNYNIDIGLRCKPCIVYNCARMLTYNPDGYIDRIRFWKTSLIYIKNVHPSTFKNEKGLEIIQEHLRKIDYNIINN